MFEGYLGGFFSLIISELYFYWTLTSILSVKSSWQFSCSFQGNVWFLRFSYLWFLAKPWMMSSVAGDVTRTLIWASLAFRFWGYSISVLCLVLGYIPASESIALLGVSAERWGYLPEPFPVIGSELGTVRLQGLLLSSELPSFTFCIFSLILHCLCWA